MKKNQWTALTAAIVLVAMVAVMCLMPTGFVARSPSTSIDLLSVRDGRSVISVRGVDSQSVDGTVIAPSITYTAQNARLSLLGLISSFLLPNRDALPKDTVYPPSETDPKTQPNAQNQADTLRTTAIVAALRQAGIEVIQKPKVMSIYQSGPSYDKVKLGDLVDAVNGKQVSTTDELAAAVRSNSVGSPIVLTVLRDRTPLDLTINLVGSSADGKIPTTGITTVNSYFYSLDISVDMDASQTNASRGLSLALGVYTLVTEEDFLSGRSVAAVGTITTDGSVATVSGIDELAKSAQLAGADILLIPRSTCSDLRGSFDGMRVIPVTNLDGAVWVLGLDDITLAPRCR